jgi:hypothetical protein
MTARYNERSWGIDLISEANIWARAGRRTIMRISGELGVAADGTTLFPDLLIHGSQGIVQGWELKFPDTPITDNELRSNAERKANILGTHSFVLWNANIAVLFVRKDVNQAFEQVKSWSNPMVIRRQDVDQNKEILKETLIQVLEEVEHLLATGSIRVNSPITTINGNFASEFIEACKDFDGSSIRRHLMTDELLRLQVEAWAIDVGLASGCDVHLELAKVNLLSWINRLLFAHLLANEFPALKSRLFKPDGSDGAELLELFSHIIKNYGFSWIFSPQLGDSALDQRSLKSRALLNDLFCQLEITSMPREALSKLLSNFNSETQHKSQGQFATPPQVAKLLVSLALGDLSGDFWDPCCGSGTLVRAAYDLKTQGSIPVKDSLEQIFASDKHLLPLQLTSMALADTKNSWAPSGLFQGDVFDASSPRSPIHGKKFSAIASNLPFVRFESIKSPEAPLVLEKLSNRHPLIDSAALGRADLFASIIFSLKQKLSTDGQMALLVSNSWLGTEWGQPFLSLLEAEFDLTCVIKSGDGVWFRNADVVTTILVLKHKSPTFSGTRFITTELALSLWDSEYVAAINRVAKIGGFSDGIRSVFKSGKELQNLRNLGLNWRLAFWETPWIQKLATVVEPLQNHFDIERGARRGWNALFYPDDSGLRLIDPRHIKPVLKTTSNQKRLIAVPDKKAFACSETLESLRRKSDTGTLAWIERFRFERNKTGKLLTDVLRQATNDWYQMDTRELADLCISMAPYKSLAVFRLRERAFVDQRLTRLSIKNEDPEILHALMNSSIGLLFIEFLGFGRGLGALDLSSTRVKNRMQILKPGLLSASERERIKRSFDLVANRDFFDTIDELALDDRKSFDLEVLSAFGLGEHLHEIHSLLANEIQERVAN